MISSAASGNVPISASRPDDASSEVSSPSSEHAPATMASTTPAATTLLPNCVITPILPGPPRGVPNEALEEPERSTRFTSI